MGDLDSFVDFLALGESLTFYALYFFVICSINWYCHFLKETLLSSWNIVISFVEQFSKPGSLTLVIPDACSG